MTEPSHATGHYVKADGSVVFHQSPQLLAVRDQLWDAIELHDTGQADSYTTMRQLDALVKQEPRSIPVHEELGGLLYDKNDWHGAVNAYYNAIRLGNEALPTDYRGTLSWDEVENRPYLRANAGMALSLYRIRAHMEATCALKRVLRLDPQDRQGCRHLLGYTHMATDARAAAREVLETNRKSEPGSEYSLALLAIREKNWIQAATALRRGFMRNARIAYGLMSGKTPPTYRGFETEQENVAYVTLCEDQWRDEPQAIPFLWWLFNEPHVLIERATAAAYIYPAGHDNRNASATNLCEALYQLANQAQNTQSEEWMELTKNADGTFGPPWATDPGNAQDNAAAGDCEIPRTGQARDRTARTKTRTAGATLS